MTLYAAWRELQKYTVTFRNGDEVLATERVYEGSAATAPSETPIKESTAQYDYSFKGWDKRFDSITGDLIVNAEFNETLRHYTVTFLSEEKIYDTQSVPYGSAAAKPTVNPTKESTERYVYAFKEWDASFESITGDLIVNAVFEESVRNYAVTFRNGADAISTQSVPYGSTATAPSDPIKASEDHVTYTFFYWGTDPNYKADKSNEYGFTDAVENELTLYAIFDAAHDQLDFNLSQDGYAVTAKAGLSAASVVIPETFNGIDVTQIGYSAFYFCTKLTSLTIPKSIKSSGQYSFIGCDNLKEVRISDLERWCEIDWAEERANAVSYANPLSFAKNLYLNGELITELVIPASVTNLKNFSFENCSGLTNVTFPDTVTSIGSFAFYGCSELIDVKIPMSVTSIGSSAFNQCGKLPSIVIPNSVTSIGDMAFLGCVELASATISERITSIGEGMFRSCGKLERVTVPERVTSIGAGAFYNCIGLTSITIPGSVASIGEKAFQGCSELTSIVFEGSQTDWNAIVKGTNWNKDSGKFTISYAKNL